jgi:tRNA A-37 threonylcarbamoyl transferase component Bud32
LTELQDRLSAALADRYVLERELGLGGMATVYLARDLKHDRRVALKVMHPELSASLGHERFLREIRVTAQLDHPHILPVLDSGEVAGLLWYTMPFVDGESLRERLRREVQLPVEEAVRLAREVADALACAHEQRIVHRDIKPENILLSRGHARVADFGVAYALEAAGADHRLTETGLAVGTPPYMSPEQASGGKADGRSDVYALGCVLYEMLAGKPPFEGPTAQAVLAAHLTATPKRLATVRPHVPRAVSEAIARALAKTPADRFRTAGEFGDALTKDIGAEPRGPLRVRFAAGGIAVALVVGVVATVTRSGNPKVMDENLLAVAPFDAVSSGVAEYREGLVTILSRSLDGAGPLRTVSPTVVVRRWAGQSDPTSAVALGHSTGAGLVVFGQVVPAGADSVRLNATVYDVRREQPLGEVEVRDARHRIDRIADTLAVRLLREVGRTRPVGAVRFAALGSTSLPAIKLFLQGEQFYRRGKWDSARAYAERAVAVDSNFTLALHRIPLALWWSDEDTSPMLLRAGARNHGLAPRESLLITVDSLWGGLVQDVGASWPLLRRLTGTAQEAVTRYPEDSEAWYMMGEIGYHFGAQVSPRLSARLSFDAFAKAIDLDSAFAPAYEHIVSLALLLREPEAARKYAEAYLHLQLDPKTSAALEASLDLLAHPRTPSPATTALLDTAPAEQVWDTWYYLSGAVDSGEAAVTAARAFASLRLGVDSGFVKQQRWVLARTLAYRGHFREAARELEAHRSSEDFSTNLTVADLLALGGLPRGSAAEWLESLLGEGSIWTWAGLGWWASVGDTTSLRRFQELAQSKIRTATAGGAEAEYWTYQANSVQPYFALSQGDTTQALTLFADLPDSLCRYCYLDRLKRAQLLSARKQDRDAATLLDEPLLAPNFATPALTAWALERGRVNERLGNREKAVESYSFVVAAWRNADPELQLLVAEARDALERLTGESSR